MAVQGQQNLCWVWCEHQQPRIDFLKFKFFLSLCHNFLHIHCVEGVKAVTVPHLRAGSCSADCKPSHIEQLLVRRASTHSSLMCGVHDRGTKVGSSQICPSESYYREEFWGWVSLERVGWAFLFNFLFLLFKKYVHFLCLCQHKPLLSRVGSSSSAASFLCKYASETCCLLEFCVPHHWHGSVSSIPACSFPLPSLHNADVAWGPILHGQSRVEHVSSPLDRDQRCG